MANINRKMVFEMPFLTIGNIDIQFADQKLIWRTHITKETLPTTWQKELINKKEFAKAKLDENIEAFVVHMTFLISKMTIHLAQKAQIALLLSKKVTVLEK